MRGRTNLSCAIAWWVSLFFPGRTLIPFQSGPRCRCLAERSRASFRRSPGDRVDKNMAKIPHMLFLQRRLGERGEGREGVNTKSAKKRCVPQQKVQSDQHVAMKRLNGEVRFQGTRETEGEYPFTPPPPSSSSLCQDLWSLPLSLPLFLSLPLPRQTDRQPLDRHRQAQTQSDTDKK